MTIKEFNQLRSEEAQAEIFKCCGSTNWAIKLTDNRPFTTIDDLRITSDTIWSACSVDDFLEAFSHHPKIGDKNSLQKKFATKEWASNEQSGVNEASDTILNELANRNEEYEKKFGFIFIVCATGKPATEMLRLQEDRLSNTIGEELHIAMGEQMKITILRFQKLITVGDWSFIKPGQLTTHVLDTAIGKPGKDISIRLQIPVNGVWQTIAQGITNTDGRIADLLPAQKKLAHGNYKLVFDTGNYFASQKIKGFYPEVEIQFIVFDDADIDAAVKGAIAGKFRNSGQTCVSINRFYIQETVYHAFAEKLTAAVKELKVGNGLDKNVQVGPLINEKGLEKVKQSSNNPEQTTTQLLKYFRRVNCNITKG